MFFMRATCTIFVRNFFRQSNLSGLACDLQTTPNSIPSHFNGLSEFVSKPKIIGLSLIEFSLHLIFGNVIKGDYDEYNHYR